MSRGKRVVLDTAYMSINSYKMRAPSSGRESNYTTILKYMNAYMMAMNLDLCLG